MLIYFARRWADSVRWIALLVFVAAVFTPPAVFAATKIITGADKGSEVHLKMGDTLEVQLKSNPTTGFMWYVQKESTPLMKLLRQSQSEPAEGDVGRPVVQTFIVEPRRTGEGRLLLHYVRSWDPPAPSEEQFEIHVVIE